jgi:hypothetical protein
MVSAPAGRALILLMPAIFYYGALIAVGGGLFEPVPHGLVFNDMLVHLLHGRFDVDPAVIGKEGYLRDGATYAYFGVAPALFRLVFLSFSDFNTLDLTRLGCLVAVSTMALFKVLTAATIARRVGSERAPLLMPLIFAAILLSGAQIEFLRASIYQEVALWADACAAAFVYLVVVGWLDEAGFSGRLVAGMALASGLCLLTKVSTALGLYIAFGCLWLLLVWRDRRLLRTFAPAVAIIIGFAAGGAAINVARWGNPLVFVDLSRASILADYPDRLARLHEFGEFNPIRLVFAVGYYFAPFWVLRAGDGHLWWQAFQQRAIDSVELPPSSFFVSDLLWVSLAAFGLVALLRHDGLPRRTVILSVLPGLLVPIVLMLTAISMTFRYRLEFYPFLELCGFAGLVRLFAAPGRRATFWIGVGAIIGIVTAHAMWLLYMLSPFGPAQEVMNGLPIVTFYRSLFP